METPSHRLVAFLCAGLFLGTVLLYAPTARYGFIGYDDPLYVDNPRVQDGLTPRNIAWAFALGPDHASNYHPVTWLSHMLDFTLAGRARPGFHHLHNVVLHAAAAAALLLVLYRATGVPWPAAGVAALFAWHPLHVQSVAWVAERKDVLCGLLFFLTIAAYAEFARRPAASRYALVLLGAAAAMLAKPMLVTLPFVLMLLDFWPLRRDTRSWRLFLDKLPLLGMAVAVSVLTVLAQGAGGAIRSTENLPLSVRLANVPVAYVRYLFKTVWPVDLAVFYPYRTWSPAVVVGAVTLLLLVTVVAVWQRRRRPYVMVGWLVFLGMLVPVIGVVQVGEQSIADRYTYLPLVGVFVMVCYAAPRGKGTGVLAAVALVACCAATLYQIRFWKDDHALFGRALEVTRDNYIAHGYVGKALAARQEDAAALSHYDRAIAIKPAYAEAHYNRGNLLLRTGRMQDAVDAYRRAVDLRPDFADAWNNLGIALATQANYADAEQSLIKASAEAPQRADIAANLARVRARLDPSR